MKNYTLEHVSYLFDIKDQLEAPTLNGYFAAKTDGTPVEEWQWAFSEAFSECFPSRREAMNFFKECKLFGDLFNVKELTGYIVTITKS